MDSVGRHRDVVPVASGERRPRVIMLSPPGAGKGTHSEYLSRASGIPHISTGELLRNEVATHSRLGREVTRFASRGDLVPDELIFEVLMPVLTTAVAATGGYLLDGFPRTMAQALRAAEIGLQQGVSSTAVVYLAAPDDVLVERLLARAVRTGRPDDTREVIMHRLEVFKEHTLPLVEYYRHRGLLMEIDADRPEEQIRADLLERLLGVRA